MQNNPELFEAQPIILSDRTGELVIIAGNQRYRAAKEVGLKEVPTVLLTGLSEQKEKEIIIRTNVTNGKWDWDRLANEWNEDELDDWGVDLPDFGEDEYGPEEPAEQQKVEEDGYDPDKDDEVQIFVKEGEIWQCGDHRLLCGDSTKAENVQRLMQGETAQLWFTDPPYNVGYGIDSHQRANGDAVLNDKQSEENFRKFLDDAYMAVKNVLDLGAAYYIFHSGSHARTFMQALEDVGDLQMREYLIWNKNSAVLSRQDYNWKHEPILYGWREGGGHNWYGDHKQTTVIDWDRPVKSPDHPTQKPVGLFGYLMQNSSKEGDIVIDTFGGSGTTMIAAEQLGRKARLIELSPKYCSVIINRWEEMTGKKAAKLTDADLTK